MALHYSILEKNKFKYQNQMPLKNNPLLPQGPREKKLHLLLAII